MHVGVPSLLCHSH